MYVNSLCLVCAAPQRGPEDLSARFRGTSGETKGAASSEDLKLLQHSGFPWESNHLYFTVREPFPSRSSQAELVFGRIERGTSLQLTSAMPDYGVIFSDGVESDFLEFNSGIRADVGISPKSGTLVQ